MRYMPPDPILGPAFSESPETTEVAGEETQPIPITEDTVEFTPQDDAYERYMADFMRMARRAFWIDVAIAVSLFVLVVILIVRLASG